MRGWRWPLILTAILVAAQFVRTSPLIDVTGAPLPDVHLAYPIGHIVFAPFALLADYLNGGSVFDFKSFAVLAVLVFVLFRLAAPRQDRSRIARELRASAMFFVMLGLFIWWGARWSRPIPRLVATDSSLLIFDTHSHTAASHDGRPGFSLAANAAWHARAGFDIAFITEHNVFEADKPATLLDGEELSLSGLHLVVLGNHALIRNRPWDRSFDSTLALIRRLHGDSVYMIASLPEYWEHHWGEDIGKLVAAGVEGFEAWTTSPKAMEFPEDLRRGVIARAREDSLGLSGATDMHGLGYAATVWNVLPVKGWSSLTKEARATAIIAAFRHSPGAVHVLAIARPRPTTRFGHALEVPAGLFMVLRYASPAHLASLLLWIWIPAFIRNRRPKPKP